MVWNIHYLASYDRVPMTGIPGTGCRFRRAFTGSGIVVANRHGEARDSREGFRLLHEAFLWCTFAFIASAALLTDIINIGSSELFGILIISSGIAKVEETMSPPPCLQNLTTIVNFIKQFSPQVSPLYQPLSTNLT
jgi:hypothetical protein